MEQLKELEEKTSTNTLIKFRKTKIRPQIYFFEGWGGEM